MAKKRMFNNEVLDTDAFLDMPLSAQALYFHLNMRADDDGFISNPNRVKSYIGASDDDLKILIGKRFLITFDDGVIVIKHWRMHNTIQKDRYTPTHYQDDLLMLGIKENKAYTLENAPCIQNVSNLYTDWKQNVSTDIDIDLDIDIDKEREKEKEREDNLSLYVQETILKTIDYLNNKLGTNFKSTNSNTQRLIMNHIIEGFKLEDFISVIDKKYEEWHEDEKMYSNLNPDTLFGDKFEKYVNQPAAKPKPNKKVETNFKERDTDWNALAERMALNS